MKKGEFDELIAQLPPEQRQKTVRLIEALSQRDDAERALLHALVDLIPAERLSAAETCMKLMVQYR